MWSEDYPDAPDENIKVPRFHLITGKVDESLFTNTAGLSVTVYIHKQLTVLFHVTQRHSTWDFERRTMT